jgi:membrane-anchored glycerophosphoryl diester phosphodiesterase (GDPDase)
MFQLLIVERGDKNFLDSERRENDSPNHKRKKKLILMSMCLS